MCARNGQKKYNKLCPREKDTEIRRERKNDFRGLDVGEGVYEGKMKNRKKLRQQGRKKGEIGRKKVTIGIILQEVKLKSKNKWKILEKEFDGITLTRYNARRDYIALYLAREQ